MRVGHPFICYLLTHKLFFLMRQLRSGPVSSAMGKKIQTFLQKRALALEKKSRKRVLCNADWSVLRGNYTIKTHDGDQIYMRTHNKDTIDLANWQFAPENRGKGRARDLLDFLEREKHAGRLFGLKRLVAGQVSNPDFCAFFEQRAGWVRDPPLGDKSEHGASDVRAASLRRRA